MLAPIRILVAQCRSDILAEVIAEAIRVAPDLDLVVGRAVEMTEVEPLLIQHNTDINVVIFIGDRPQTALATLLRQRHGVVISYILFGTDIVHFDLQQIGLEQLLATLRVLARNRASDRAIEYKVVGCRSSGSGRAELVPLCADRDSLIAHALRWVDATLLLYDSRYPAAPDDVPGFARSASAVADALQRGPGGNTEIEGATRAVDQAELRLTEELTAADPHSSPLAALKHNLGLTPLEVKLVLLCLAPELDPKYQAVFGVFNDDLGRRAPTLALACALLGDPLEVRIALGDSGGLVRWRLLENGVGLPHADEPLRLEPAVVAWLFGDSYGLLNDVQLQHIVESDPWPEAAALSRSTEQALCGDLAALLSNRPADLEWLVLTGEDPAGWRALVEAAAGVAGVTLLRLSLAACAGASAEDADEIAIRIARAVQAVGAAPVLDAAEPPEPGGFDIARRLITVLRGLPRPAVAIVQDPQQVADALPGGSRLMRRSRLDSTALGAALVAATRDVGLTIAARDAEALAASFPLNLDGIKPGCPSGRSRRDSSRSRGTIGAAVRSLQARRQPGPAPFQGGH